MATTEEFAAATHLYTDGQCSVGLLVTGDDIEVQEWLLDAWPDVLDRRGHTTRCRVFFRAGETTPEAALAPAIAAARERDVTLQLLCTHERLPETRRELSIGEARAVVHDLRETYPVLHLASDGRQWKAST